MIIDTRGLFNTKHRKWNLYPGERDGYPFYCLNCYQKDINDSLLELILRLHLTYKLRVENDNFSRIFTKYPQIKFNLLYQKEIIHNEQIQNETDLVGYFLSTKLTLGVEFTLPLLFKIKHPPATFTIPILKEGKMWQLIMTKIFKAKDESSVDSREWFATTWFPLKCLFCHDYPRDLYPGNFIINQNILYMKSFIWVDKRKIHIKHFKKKRKVNNVENRQQQQQQRQFIMYNDSFIINWPILTKYYCNNNNNNALNNMAVYSMGDIFISFIDILIAKIKKLHINNNIINKLKPFYYKKKRKSNFLSLDIKIEDLIHMHKMCKRTKKYEIGNDRKIRIKNHLDGMEGEKLLINLISNNNNELLNDENSTREIIKWLHFSRGPTTEISIINNLSQMIKMGEIDIAVSQTSILDKDYINFEKYKQDVPSIIGAGNYLDFHRTGRFTKNAPTNSYYNICGIACSVQKMLTKDSKTTKPKYINKDEIGFIDLIITADTPKNSGLVLESVLDCFISTPSGSVINMFKILNKLFPSGCRKIINPECFLPSDDDDDGFIYICANQVLYQITPQIPATLTEWQLAYLSFLPSSSSYFFKMTQYALKVLVPFIELLEEKENKFWICTSFNKNLYKLHVDGLFYSPKEYLLIINNNNNNIPNLFGPSLRLTPFPINCHLPRIGHAAYTAKNFIGTPTNSLAIGELHQKSQSVAFHASKSYPTELINQPGWFPKILIAGGFNNQEDGITVRKGAIDSGKFSAVSYETASIKLIYNNYTAFTLLTFKPLIKKSDALRVGMLIGLFETEIKNNNEVLYLQESTNITIEIFSPELIVKATQIMKNGNEREITIKDKETITFFHDIPNNWTLYVFWIGSKQQQMFINNHHYNNNKRKHHLSLSSRAKIDNDCRCENIRCDNIETGSYLKMYLCYAMHFVPSIGDKLQTTTTNKGVIVDIISDENMPFIIHPHTKKNFIPDLIINPFYLKRQTLDNVLVTGYNLTNKKKNPYLNNSFQFNINDAIHYIKLGDELVTGILINPTSGLPYIKPILQNDDDTVAVDYKRKEILKDDDGFTYILRGNPSPTPHEIVKGSIYTTRYFMVNNHKASSMMQCSHPDDIIRTEFSGAPTRGKKGGFATGLQEQMAFSGMGLSRFITEISQIRSETSILAINKKEIKNVGDNNSCEYINSSNTFKRIYDEFVQSNVDIGFSVNKHRKISLLL